MFPYVTIFGRSLPMYGIVAAIGALLTGFFACRATKKAGYDDNDMITLMLLSAVGAVIGGHLFYSIVTVTEFVKKAGFSGLAAVFSRASENGIQGVFGLLWELFGGMVFYGGLIGGLAVGLLLMRIKKYPAEFTDIFAPAIPFFHGFGRIGCFLSGCCYGVECDFGVTFEHGVAENVNGISRFPVQLLESSLCFALAAFLYVIYRGRGKLFPKLKKHFKRCLLPLYLVLYAVIRFGTEFLRGDAYRGFVGTLSVSQFVSVIMFAVGILSIALIRKNLGKKAPQSEE